MGGGRGERCREGQWEGREGRNGGRDGGLGEGEGGEWERAKGTTKSISTS